MRSYLLAQVEWRCGAGFRIYPTDSSNLLPPDSLALRSDGANRRGMPRFRRLATAFTTTARRSEPTGARFSVPHRRPLTFRYMRSAFGQKRSSVLLTASRAITKAPRSNEKKIQNEA